MKEITMYKAEGVPDYIPRPVFKDDKVETRVLPPIFETPEEATACEKLYEDRRKIERFLAMDQAWVLANWSVIEPILKVCEAQK